MRKLISRLIHNSYTPLPNHSPIYRKDVKPVFKKSELENGIKVVTESAKFPSCVNLGFVLKVGSRNDPVGYLDIYKELFLKSRLRSDQAQYAILELSGCDITLTLERENIYIHTSCLEEHLSLVIPAIKHAIFHDKDEIDTQKAVDRFLDSLVPENIDNNFKNMLLPAAYSNLTLGIRHPKVEFCEIDHNSLTEFMINYFTSDRLTIAASGVKNHESFVEIAHKSFASIPKSYSKTEEKAVYTGGIVREEINEEMAYVTLAFQGASFFDKDMFALILLRTIIGQGGGFSTGGPGKGMHSRAYTKILPYGFLESVKAINHNFTDSGVFALSLVGFEKYVQHVPELILKEIVDLLKVGQEEISRAKNIIARETLINYQKSESRVEDIAKTCSFFNQTPEEFEYLEKINKVTDEDIKKGVINLLRSKFTLTALTKKESKLPNLEELYKKLGR